MVIVGVGTNPEPYDDVILHDAKGPPPQTDSHGIDFSAQVHAPKSQRGVVGGFLPRLKSSVRTGSNVRWQGVEAILESLRRARMHYRGASKSPGVPTGTIS